MSWENWGEGKKHRRGTVRPLPLSQYFCSCLFCTQNAGVLAMQGTSLADKEYFETIRPSCSKADTLSSPILGKYSAIKHTNWLFFLIFSPLSCLCDVIKFPINKGKKKLCSKQNKTDLKIVTHLALNNKGGNRRVFNQEGCLFPERYCTLTENRLDFNHIR